MDGYVVGVLGGSGAPVPSLQPPSNGSQARSFSASDQGDALYVECRDDGVSPRWLVYRGAQASGRLRPRVCSRIRLQPEAQGLNLVGPMVQVLRAFGYRLSDGGLASASRVRR